MFENRHDRPLTALLGDLMQDAATLVRKEVALARAEMSEKISQAGTGVAYLVIGGALAFAALLVLLDALVLALVEILDISPTLAALIVGVIIAIIGLVLVQKGRRDLKPSHLTPERTVDSIRRDAQLAKEQVK